MTYQPENALTQKLTALYMELATIKKKMEGQKQGWRGQYGLRQSRKSIENDIKLYEGMLNDG